MPLRALPLPDERRGHTEQQRAVETYGAATHPAQTGACALIARHPLVRLVDGLERRDEPRRRRRSDCEYAMLLPRSEGATPPTTLLASVTLFPTSCEIIELAYPPYVLRFPPFVERC